MSAACGEDRLAGVHAVIPARRTVVLGGSPAVARLTLGWREGGAADAPALVFLHGIGSNSTGYRYQFDGFDGRFRVIAWDAPGYGVSTPFPCESPAAEDYADALAALLDALAIPACHLCGSSMGAVIAVVFAARHPDRLRSLILSAPAPSADAIAPADRAARAQQRIDDLARLGAEALAAQRSAFLVGAKAPPKVLDAVRGLVAAVLPQGYGQGARMVANTEYLAAASRVRAPTLIFRGSEDKLGAGAAPLHATVPGAVFMPFEGVGHMIKLEAPALFNRRIAEFVDGHR